jgi:hypothetical protein
MSRRFRETPKSEMDAQREMLDELMGVNRNMDRAEDEINDYQVSFTYHPQTADFFTLMNYLTIDHYSFSREWSYISILKFFI